MKMIYATAAGLAAMLSALPAQANEEQFLDSLSGQYAGKGEVRLRTDRKPISVNCTFDTKASAETLSLNGRCRGLVVVSRAIGADLKRKGGSYSGSYTGAGSGTAALAGKRSGETLNLSIRWAKAINGDRSANLSVAKVGKNGLTLTTTDKDPKSGDMVVTSKIVLKRQ